MAQVIWTQKIAFYQAEILTDKDEKLPQMVELLPANEWQISRTLTRLDKRNRYCGASYLGAKPMAKFSSGNACVNTQIIKGIYSGNEIRFCR